MVAKTQTEDKETKQGLNVRMYNMQYGGIAQTVVLLLMNFCQFGCWFDCQVFFSF